MTVDLESEKPVGMYDSQMKTLKEKPVANVYINNPIELQEIPGINDLSEIMNKRKEGQSLTTEDRKRFSELKQALENQSDIIMQSLASQLPDDKKGEYKNTSDDNLV